MKKLLKVLFAISMAVVTLFALTACNNFEGKAVKLIDAEPESYAYAVLKGTSADVLTAVNEVLEELGKDKINALVSYYFKVAANEEAGTCPITIPNVSNNTGGTLKIGTEPGFAPFEFMNGTKVDGFDIAIMTLTAKKLNRKLDVVVYDSFAGMEAGAGTDFEVIAAGYTKTDAREVKYDFSNDYYTSQQYVVCAVDKDYSKLEDLKGLKIGVQTATTAHYLIEGELEEGGILFGSGTTAHSYDSYTVAFLDLKKGTIDVIVIDELPAQMLVK